LSFSVFRQFSERREAPEGQNAQRKCFALPVFVAGGLSDLDDQEYLPLGADYFDRVDVNRIRRSLVRRLGLRATE
jgi:hypothetical protein